MSAVNQNKQKSKNSNSSSTNADSSLILNSSWKILNATEKLGAQDVNYTESPIHVKILYESNTNQNTANTRSNNTLNKCDINENCTLTGELTKGQTLLTSYFRPIERKSNNSNEIVNNAKKHTAAAVDDDNDFDDNPLEIVIDDYAPTNELINDSKKTVRKCLFLHRKRVRQKYNRISTVRQRFVERLVRLAKTSRKRFSPNWHRFHVKSVLFVYQCIISFHRFTSAFVQGQSKQKATTATTTTLNESVKMTTEAITINRRVQKLLNDNTHVKETNDDVTTVTTPSHSDGGAKRPPKSQRASDNSRLLLLTENAHESSEKDFGMEHFYIITYFI